MILNIIILLLILLAIVLYMFYRPKEIAIYSGKNYTGDVVNYAPANTILHLPFTPESFKLDNKYTVFAFKDSKTVIKFPSGNISDYSDAYRKLTGSNRRPNGGIYISDNPNIYLNITDDYGEEAGFYK
jgi:hypothetical protein